MKRRFPPSIAGQLQLAVILVLIGSQVLTIMLILGVDSLRSRSEQDGRVIARLLRDLGNLPNPLPSSLPRVVAEVPGQGVSFLSANNRADLITDTIRQPDLEVRLRRELEDAGLRSPGTGGVRIVRHTPGKPIDGQPRPLAYEPAGEVFHPARPPDIRGSQAAALREVVASVQVAPGIWFNMLYPYYSSRFITIRAAGAFLLSIALATLIFVPLSRRIVRPLSALAATAERFGRGDTPTAIPEKGPREVRVAAAAFNRMQERIARLLETQRTMLRGVSHDLRMPIARLRMRAEQVPDPDERARIVAGLDEMTTMIGAVLQAARDTSAEEPMVETDIGALAEAVAADATDAGQHITCELPPARVVLRCRPSALRRALANLADNAARYGGGGRISVARRGGGVEIAVMDDGPGIPEEAMSEAMEPFVRLAEDDGTGAGLGLSIARATVEAHGGEMQLGNRSGGGLRVVLRLPVRA